MSLKQSLRMQSPCETSTPNSVIQADGDEARQPSQQVEGEQRVTRLLERVELLLSRSNALHADSDKSIGRGLPIVPSSVRTGRLVDSGHPEIRKSENQTRQFSTAGQGFTVLPSQIKPFMQYF